MNETRSSARRRYAPWLMALIALLAFSLAVSLGRWQLSRAAQKEALQAGIEAQNALPPLDMQTFLAMPSLVDMLHRTVRLRGLWLGTQTVYLDNRQMHGVPGFYVLTPLALEGTQQTVMVQRGWVQRNFDDRAKVPAFETPAGIVEVTGRVAAPPGRLLDLGPLVKAPTVQDGNGASGAVGAPAGAASAAGQPALGPSPIRQNLDLENFRAETQLPLRTDVTLMQTGSASEGLQRDWTAPNLGVEKHYGYAFQWFGLAALVAILYVWFQFIAPRRRKRHVSEA